MPIFSKHNTEKTAVLKSGCGSLTIDQVKEINRTLYEDGEGVTDHEALFVKGFLAGLMFVAVPKDAETYNLTPRGYLDNAYSYVFEDYLMELMSDTLGDAARNIFESLGINGNVRVMTADEFVNGDDA